MFSQEAIITGTKDDSNTKYKLESVIFQKYVQLYNELIKNKDAHQVVQDSAKELLRYMSRKLTGKPLQLFREIAKDHVSQQD